MRLILKNLCTVVSAALVAALTGAGCRAEGPDGADLAAAPDIRAELEGLWNDRCETSPVRGSVALIAGDDAYDANLFSVELCPLQVQRLTPQSRYSSVDQAGGIVVVTNASQQIDHLGVVADGQLVGVPGLGSPHAYTPAVSPEGVIAYVPGGEESFRVVTWDTRTDTSDELYSTLHPAGLLAWGPDHSLAVVVSPPGVPPSLVILPPDRSGAVTIPLDIAAVGNIAWGSSNLLAVSPTSDQVGASVVIDMGTRTPVGETPAGWGVIDWSPDGDLLLVHRGDQVGYTSASALGEVKELGTFPDGAVLGGAWA